MEWDNRRTSRKQEAKNKRYRGKEVREGEKEERKERKKGKGDTGTDLG